MNESRTTGTGDQGPKKPQKGAQTQAQKREAGGESRALVTWTIVMAVATWALAGITLWAVHKQGHDAAQLLSVQISNELDKQFDSVEFRSSRRQFAQALLTGKEPPDYRVLDFLEKTALYVQHGAMDEDTAYSEFSYYVERYWPAAANLIKEFRQTERDPSYYSNLESWYGEIKKMNASRRRSQPDANEIAAFVKEEAGLDP
jgi:hypothetical protein